MQYVEFMLEVLPTKTAKTKPLRLSVRREELCSDVIGHFGFHDGQCRGFPKQKLFQRTSVVFIDANGDEEEGNDLGGLTVEMYSSFFREVLRATSASSRASLTARAAGAASACCRSPTRQLPRSRPLVAPFASAPRAPKYLLCNVPWLALMRLSTPRACVQVRA